MSGNQLTGRAQGHLYHLCRTIGERPVGSAGNRAATAYFAATVDGFSFETERQSFSCMDWQDGGASLHVGNESLEVRASPYSLGTHVEGELIAVASDEALEAIRAKGKILLLHGEIAAEQLMPKHFPFYNPEHHQRIIALLESKRPLAIVCATARNPELAGGLYPFPLIEDGDFDIPSVFTTDVEGARLLSHLGQIAVLESRGRRIPAQAENVIARKGNGERRIVVCAHIDAKIGTPGAVDNGGGVVVLLLLAQLLADYDGDLGIEIVALNGEDYYSAPGQKLYLAKNENKMAEIMLAINLDGVGYRKGKSAFSLYGCPPGLERIVRQTLGASEGTVEGPAWYQSDHSIFIQQGVPAAAITSEAFWELWREIAHTPNDVPDLVDPGRLVESAQALRDFVLELNGASTSKASGVDSAL